ncbi:FitA-like ribbon-helix-helix domain-containing protein [Rhodovibrio sodomensis]|uniref:FitA-like ribbon-helix-helix domain-containing protein n=1 Tax=Rhodovibrio sodomensis TaxID=1088 RepID=UPI0019041F70|nr:hypothetical protein [Rhodovibrio sodomensis]
MAEIEVLDIDDDLMARLAERADQRGHSVEDEVRTILERVLRMPSESELLVGGAIAPVVRSDQCLLEEAAAWRDG